MKKDILTSSRLGESYTRIKHDSGLTICLYPMRGFSSAFAIFGTRYGSVDTTFKTNEDADFVTVPEGIAHYLEHKLFEGEECNAFENFSKTGAFSNAFTSFDTTAYHFTCAGHFAENLRTLLDFVQNPYFTDENVQKEQGIIAQEIKIYLDDPGWRVFFNGLGAVYHNNPVRIDIAGTVESIAQINKELLYRCYRTFYNLNNMTLSIAGNFDPDEALKICDEMLKPSKDIGLKAIVPDEPAQVKEKRVSQKLYCALPLFQLAFKMPNLSGKEGVKNYIIHNIMLDAALGGFSPFYTRFYESGLINDTFSASVFKGRGFFLPIISGDSRDPDKVAEEVKKELARLKNDGIPKEDFETVKKTTYGDLIGIFNNVGGVAKSAMNADMNGIDLYENLEMTASVTYDDVMGALTALDTENSSLSVVEPLDRSVNS
ncbi:MAG: insulinase family protein [Ruminiclostridium sp.]|nr:insulinase family protein [Ruminiclostridium sp.]